MENANRHCQLQTGQRNWMQWAWVSNPRYSYLSYHAPRLPVFASLGSYLLIVQPLVLLLMLDTPDDDGHGEAFFSLCSPYKSNIMGSAIAPARVEDIQNH